MKLWSPAALLAAALLVSRAPAVDAGGSGSDSSQSRSSDVGFNSSSPVDVCLGLPRNTLLASCPAPCVADAPCIVYDQDAAHDKLTGCDYGTAHSNSFCWSRPTQTCEIHCFAKTTSEWVFEFKVKANTSDLGEPKARAAEDPSLIAAPTTNSSYQSNSFVVAVGQLNLSKEITTMKVIGDVDDVGVLVDVAVDPALLANISSVTSLTMSFLPLDNDQVAVLVTSAPPKLKELNLQSTDLNGTLSWKMFAPMGNLEKLYLSDNQISLIAGEAASMLALTELYVDGNKLTGFTLQAPNLETLDLHNNKLARIPDSVFTYTQLQILNLDLNPIIRPLVLTAMQVQFLEALPTLTVRLVDPPDDALVSRLDVDGEGVYGDYSDDVDLSVLLEGAQEILIREDKLPVRVVDDETAATYNNLLEIRARVRRVPSRGVTQYKPVPDGTCEGVQRNTLISNCVANVCPTNGACVAYDQHNDLSLLSGCDYDLASTSSACVYSRGTQGTCEFQCFAAYEPQSQFQFFIPFQSELGQKIARHPVDDELEKTKTREVPFLSNSFVNKVGQLKLTSTVTEVLIAGGRSERLSRDRVADVVIDSKLLRKAPSVTSLSLLNLDLSKSDLAAILVSASPALKSLNLRNTKLRTLPERIFANSKQLEKLTLAQNELAMFDVTATTLGRLKTLDLSENGLRTVSFDAPNLKTLDLSVNNLMLIPRSVYSIKGLDTLNLEDNPFATPVVLAEYQVAFFSSVRELKFPQLPPLPQRANATDIAALLVKGATATILRGIDVVITSEQLAQQYNDQLEQQQRESPLTLPTRSPSGGDGGGDGSTSSSTSTTLTNSSTNSNERSSSSTGTASTGGTTTRPTDTTGSPAYSDDSDPSSVRDKSTTPASKAEEGTAGKRSLMLKLVLGGFASAFVVVVVFLVTFVKRHRRTASKGSSYVAVPETPGGSSGLGPRPLLPSGVGSETLGAQAGSDKIVLWWKDEVLLSHRLNAAGISDLRVIGSGNSGVVWLVSYRGGCRKLVSKRLVQGEGAAPNAKLLRLVTEAKIASTLRYGTIVQLVGVAWTDKTDLQVVYEYMSNGDLGSYLARTDAVTLPWMPAKLQLTIDIIEALVYTHSFNPPLLHRDLKASNVLLDDDLNAKLGGFGCARLESESDTMTTSGVGTGRWLAPEVLSRSTSYGTPSDIYSFGVLLCELDTHQVPYAEDAQKLPESALLQRVARGELRPSVSASCPPEIRELVEACLAFDPVQRPTALQVAFTLRSLRTQLLHE